MAAVAGAMGTTLGAVWKLARNRSSVVSNHTLAPQLIKAKTLIMIASSRQVLLVRSQNVTERELYETGAEETEGSAVDRVADSTLDDTVGLKIFEPS